MARKNCFRWFLVFLCDCRPALIVPVFLTFVGCSSQPGPKAPEVAYVRGTGTPLFDQLGPSSQAIGTLESGEQVEILGKRPRWVQVRLEDDRGGWVQVRRLASQQVFEQFQRLAQEARPLPSQGTALLRRETTLHLEPSLSSETFYGLAEREEVEVLQHRAVEKPSAAIPAQAALDQTGELGTSAESVVKELEDWFLVRASKARTGWLRENSFDMNVPLEVAQYREGLRIRVWFVLREEQGQERPWYLWATIRRVAGLPYDFDEIRVFTWNPARSRYETAHRERNLIGFYPIEVSKRETPGSLTPAFSLQLEDQTGQRFRKNYILVGRTVRPES